MSKPLPVARCMLARSLLLATWLLGTALPAEASLFKGEALDTAADVLAWVVMILVPIGGLWLFWLVHVMPEKIAEKKGHPQAQAIKTLCLLSLVFGGMLWPIAWLWAYSKPVLYKLAYGTDRVDHHAEADVHEPGAADADKGRAA
jgi:Protein of unknown function (DUF3302)